MCMYTLVKPTFHYLKSGTKNYSSYAPFIAHQHVFIIVVKMHPISHQNRTDLFCIVECDVEKLKPKIIFVGFLWYKLESFLFGCIRNEIILRLNYFHEFCLRDYKVMSWPPLGREDFEGYKLRRVEVSPWLILMAQIRWSKTDDLGIICLISH